MPNQEWSDYRKWWMELTKWLLVTAGGFALTFFIFSGLEKDRAEQSNYCSQIIERKQKSLAQFDAAASTYLTSTYLAFNDLYRWRTEYPSEPITRWWSSAYIGLDTALRSLDLSFPILRSETKKFSALIERNFKLIDSIIDSRLDVIEKMYNLPKQPTEEDRWWILRPISRHILDSKIELVKKNINALKETQTGITLFASEYLALPSEKVCKAN